jgi:polyphenol oxidase
MLYAQHPLSEIPLGFVTANQPLPYARHLFGTREHSAAKTTDTLHALVESFGPIASMHQVHGARVVEVQESGHEPECDAIITRNPDLWLAVKTADCVPILISSPYAVAAVHAGWRSAEAGILPLTIEKLCSTSNHGPEELTFALGPCLQQANFEVEAAFIHRFAGEFGVHNASHYFNATADKHKMLMDLPGLLMAQARAAGALDIQLHSVGRCTYAQPAKYHSHRRHTHELAQGIDTPCWRQVSLIRRLGGL